MPNRHKTQKWQQAKTYNYDGDDWGGYDPYDEYGGEGYEEHQQQHQPQEPPMQARRQASFGSGDERRQFSAGPVMQGVQLDRNWSPAGSAGSGAGGRGSNDYQRRQQRDFTNPDQAPPPLNTKMSPAPGPATAPAASSFPPRKQSRSNGSPAPDATPTSTAKEKELPTPPFIRPSDIYRRMEAEREKERQSSEGSRPSMESLQREREMTDSPAGSQRPLSAVEESPQKPQGPFSAGDDFGEPRQRDGWGASRLPPIQGGEGFGSGLSPAAARSDAMTGSDTSGGTKAVQTMPVATRAPLGSDPAAEILGERTSTRAFPGHDPAADILAERTRTRALPGRDPTAEIMAERSQTSSTTPVTDSLQTTPTATRAPPDSDPAADTLAERTSQFTRALPAHDPAADILAERSHPTTTSATDSLQTTPTATRAPPGYDPAAEILAERTHARALPGHDPAAEILAERSHPVPVSSIGRQPDQLSHQPSGASQGYKSLVSRAFDRPDDPNNSIPATPVSRDGSQSLSSHDSSGVSRSNTNSTSGISPIMSRVPSAATAQQRQQAQMEQVPTIAEEPQSRVSSDSYRIPRKPSPSHSRDTSSQAVGGVAAAAAGAAAVGAVTGYRRSLDPPSSDNSPARSPGLENSSSRRLSTGLTAETFTAETPAVEDQGVEMHPMLEPAETPASEIDQQELPTTRRARAGTDYSVREVDLANDVNDSPDKGEFSPEIAEAERANRDLFLRTHTGTPGSPTSRTTSPVNESAAAGLGIAGETESGRASPAKGRVREIAGKYQDIHDASRRNSEVSVGSSKSSWSNFHGSEENLAKGVKRSGTGQSNLVSESDYGAGWEDRMEEEDGGGDDRGIAGEEVQQEPLQQERPGMETQPSFRPHLPGEWVSYRATPASETPAMQTPAPIAEERVITPRASQQGPPEHLDLTPTTRKVPLEGSHSPQSPVSTSSGSNPLSQAKDAGSALGAALMASVGIGQGHQTRDFGSTEPPAPVEQPDMQFRAGPGDRGYLNAPQRPWLPRGDTDASVASTVGSVSEAAPTPPEKDTPLPPAESDRRSQYFSGVPVAPLKTTGGSAEMAQARPNLLPSLSTASGTSSLQRDDSLRREIVRSLDTPRRDDAARTQDALDAPENLRRVEEGKQALSAVEINDDSPSKPQPLRMLDQRFSWENRPQDRGALDSSPAAARNADVKVIHAPVPRVQEPERTSPEIKPEMPYERPRSRGLHIVNADGDSSDEEVREPKAAERGMEQGLPSGAAAAAGVAGAGMVGVGAATLVPRSSGPVSPITKSQENLHSRSLAEQGGGEDNDGAVMRDLMPSPISEGEPRLPSYYLKDTPTTPPAEEAEPETAAGVEDAPRPPSKDVSSTAASPISPTKQGKIPPFREILAIKSPDARIRTYDDTRQTFADMNTGLSDWLSGMLAQHPEHANLSTTPAYRPAAALRTTSGTFPKGHRVSPSIAKFTKGFTSTADLHRSNTVATPAGGGGDAGPDVPPKTQVDIDKLQQRGKAVMKGAGVLGGKAAGGAKGLLAKGRSRFGTQREARSKV